MPTSGAPLNEAVASSEALVTENARLRDRIARLEKQLQDPQQSPQKPGSSAGASREVDDGLLSGLQPLQDGSRKGSLTSHPSMGMGRGSLNGGPGANLLLEDSQEAAREEATRQYNAARNNVEQMVDVVEYSEDSPYSRRLFQQQEKALDSVCTRLRKIQAKAKAFCVAVATMSERCHDFANELRLGSGGESPELVSGLPVDDALMVLGDMLEHSSQYSKILSSQVDNVLGDVCADLIRDAVKATESAKKLAAAQQVWEKALNAWLARKKPGFGRRSKALQEEKEHSHVIASRRNFELARFDHIQLLNQVHGFWRVELSETACATIHSFVTFFNQGNFFSSSISDQVDSMNTQIRAQKSGLIDLRRRYSDRRDELVQELGKQESEGGGMECLIADMFPCSDRMRQRLVSGQFVGATAVGAAGAGNEATAEPTSDDPDEDHLLLPRSRRGSRRGSLGLLSGGHKRNTTQTGTAEELLGTAGCPIKVPDKEGFLNKQSNNMTRDWKQRWFVLEDSNLYYLRSLKEGRQHVVNVLLCSVRPAYNSDRRFVFELLSASKRPYLLQASSEQDMKSWILAFQKAVGHALVSQDIHSSSKSNPNSQVVTKLMKELRRENSACVDCGTPNPDWASINLGVSICIECCGVHRSLGVHISKPRGLDLDVWDSPLLRMMLAITNTKFNEVYEGSRPRAVAKLTPKAPREEREDYIRSKYVKKAFLNIALVEAHPEDEDDQTAELHRAVARDDVLTVVTLLALQTDKDGRAPSIATRGLHQTVTGEETDPDSSEDSHSDSEGGSNSRRGSLVVSPPHPSEKIPSKGQTALHVAARYDSIRCAELLIQSDAQVFAKDTEGRTALQLAQDLNNTAVAGRLSVVSAQGGGSSSSSSSSSASSGSASPSPTPTSARGNSSGSLAELFPPPPPRRNSQTGGDAKSAVVTSASASSSASASGACSTGSGSSASPTSSGLPPPTTTKRRFFGVMGRGPSHSRSQSISIFGGRRNSLTEKDKEELTGGGVEKLSATSEAPAEADEEAGKKMKKVKKSKIKVQEDGAAAEDDDGGKDSPKPSKPKLTKEEKQAAKAAKQLEKDLKKRDKEQKKRDKEQKKGGGLHGRGKGTSPQPEEIAPATATEETPAHHVRPSPIRKGHRSTKSVFVFPNLDMNELSLKTQQIRREAKLDEPSASPSSPSSAVAAAVAVAEPASVSPGRRSGNASVDLGSGGLEGFRTGLKSPPHRRNASTSPPVSRFQPTAFQGTSTSLPPLPGSEDDLSSSTDDDEASEESSVTPAQPRKQVFEPPPRKPAVSESANEIPSNANPKSDMKASPSASPRSQRHRRSKSEAPAEQPSSASSSASSSSSSSSSDSSSSSEDSSDSEETDSDVPLAEPKKQSVTQLPAASSTIHASRAAEFPPGYDSEDSDEVGAPGEKQSAAAAGEDEEVTVTSKIVIGADGKKRRIVIRKRKVLKKKPEE